MFVISAYEGQAIRVGDRRVTVGMLRSPGLVEVAVDGEPEAVPISADRKVELFPKVFVSMERNKTLTSRIKFLFDAPRSVFIRELPNDASARDNSQP